MSDAAVAKLKLRLNLADYPGTAALRTRQVASPLFDIDFSGPMVAYNGFKPMLRENAFDGGELALATYFQALVYGKPYVMLPITIVGRLQHQCLVYNRDRGVLSPRDLEGCRVGVRSYAQTTGLWLRGILQHDHGVDLRKVTWMTTEEAHLAEYADPPNCLRLPPDASLTDMLLAGELDAAIVAGEVSDPRLVPIITHPATAGEEWRDRNGFVPINHVFVVHRDLSRRHPEVVRELYRVLVDARDAIGENGKTLLPLGVDANRKALETAIELSVEQGLIPRALSIDELFDETTAPLV